MMTKLKIEGMTCNHCVMAVTKALSGVAGVDKVVGVDLDSGEASVEGQAEAAQLIAVIGEEGYEAQLIQ